MSVLDVFRSTRVRVIDRPRQIEGLFAAVCAGVGPEPGAIGAVILSFDAILKVGPPLCILEWMYAATGGALTSFLPEVFERLEEIRQSFGRLVLHGDDIRVLIEPKGMGKALLARGLGSGLLVQTIKHEEILEMDFTERAIAATAYIDSGAVQITKEAHAKRVDFMGAAKNYLERHIGALSAGDNPQRAPTLLVALADAVLEAMADSPELCARAGGG